MTITVRHLRRGIAVRLTGAHAQAINGLLLDLLDRADPPAAGPATPAPEPAPAEAEPAGQATPEIAP